ncbi:MAG TPA: PDZ domain-containing protein [Candidatus Acidoferrales bacterium]|nr:PDZ domain-containing protein [Candidatus Acidoferrales bacterium]
MNTKPFLALGAAAVIAIGLGIASGQSASAQDQKTHQDQKPPQDCSDGWAVRQDTIDAMREQMATMKVDAARLAAAAKEEYAQNAAPAIAKIQAQLAEAFAQQDADSPRQRVIIDGQGLSLRMDSGWLGVSPEDVTSDRAKELKLSSPRGVYISEVEKDSPAEKAGLKSGDVIVEYNGEHVEGSAQLRRLVSETTPGHMIPAVIWRDGHEQTLNITVGQPEGPMRTWTMPRVAPMAPEPPETPEAPRAFSFQMPDMGGNFLRIPSAPTLGISAEDLDGQLGTYFGAPDGEGILVREVESNSPAEKAGFKAGDVIVKIAGDRVKNLGEMREKLRDKREDKTVQVTVLRRGTEQTLTVEPNKPQTRTAVRARGVAF